MLEIFRKDCLLLECRIKGPQVVVRFLDESQADLNYRTHVWSGYARGLLWEGTMLFSQPRLGMVEAGNLFQPF
jgi:hypothetical protein